jgi:hypothetical protein
MPSPFPGMNRLWSRTTPGTVRGHRPIRLREPLPPIPIRLAPDPDVCIDLQSLLHAIHDAAGYDRFIYTGESNPPLRGDMVPGQDN